MEHKSQKVCLQVVSFKQKQNHKKISHIQPQSQKWHKRKQTNWRLISFMQADNVEKQSTNKIIHCSMKEELEIVIEDHFLRFSPVLDVNLYFRVTEKRTNYCKIGHKTFLKCFRIDEGKKEKNNLRGWGQVTERFWCGTWNMPASGLIKTSDWNIIYEIWTQISNSVKYNLGTHNCSRNT